RRRHTRWPRDWSSDVCSSDLAGSVSWYFTSSPPTISPTFLGGKLYVGCVGCPSWYSGAGYGADFVFATYVNTSTVQLPTIAATTDRKSTRLNSSHVATAYAVV